MKLKFNKFKKFILVEAPSSTPISDKLAEITDALAEVLERDFDTNMNDDFLEVLKRIKDIEKWGTPAPTPKSPYSPTVPLSPPFYPVSPIPWCPSYPAPYIGDPLPNQSPTTGEPTQPYWVICSASYNGVALGGGGSGGAGKGSNLFSLASVT